MIVLLALTILSSLTSALSFEDWAIRMNKHYTPAESLRRKAIYNKNSVLVKRFNDKHSFKLSTDGPFADLTNEEYKNKLKFKGETLTDRVTLSKTNLKSIDWTSKMPPVRDQAQCGSCYSFATLGALEGRLIIKEGLIPSKVDFSEQQIVDCSTSYGNHGCNGGGMANSYLYIKKIGGIMAESDYSYTATNEECKFNSNKVKATVDGRTNLDASEDTLAAAVTEGPVAVAIDASHFSFQLYTGGIYDEPKCSSTTLDHGVVCVGFGQENGVEYWIVRNSWGSSWGESGYVRMIKGSNQCGIATMATYPNNPHSI